MRFLFLSAVLCASVSYTALAKEASDINVTEAYAFPNMSGMPMGAAFLSVKNNKTEACELKKAESSITETIELHDNLEKDGVMRMIHMVSVTIPASKEVIFKPGGKHLMLLGLKKKLQEKDEFTVLLDFGACGTLNQLFTVKPRP